MRFRITFNRKGRQRMLPMDYQYYISAWIYKVLKLSDREFAHFLHEQGYGSSPTKLYKLFCFSRLDFGKPTLWKERKLFEINSDLLTLEIAFDVHEAASNFIKGLFIGRTFFLGNQFNGLDMEISAVEALAEPVFSEDMHYRLLTPWVVSYRSAEDKHPRYLSPEDDDFEALALKHLAEKYKHTRASARIAQEQLAFKRINGFKRAGFVMKPETPMETRVVGNLFDFTLTAPPGLHQMIWNAGVSEKSSSGFGWVEEGKRLRGRD